MTSVIKLLQHIWLGFAHVMAFLFLPTHKSFQTIHELTESGYQVSYLDHCRTQHNVRFGTLAYSLVLACSIALVVTTVQIIYPERFSEPVYAATLTVNNNGDDNDGTCDGGGGGVGDCTLREAIDAAVANDVITFSGSMAITLQSAVTLQTDNVDIQVGSSTVTLDCNSDPSFQFGLQIQSDGNTISGGDPTTGLIIKNCNTGINIAGDNVAITDVGLQNNTDGITFNSSTGSSVDGVIVAGIDGATSGISLVSAVTATVTNATISNVNRGININGGSGGTIQDNSLYDIGEFAIITDGAVSDYSITGNKLGVDGIPLGLTTAGGIYLDDAATGITIDDNRFAGLTDSSVQVNGTSHIISDNTMADDADASIYVRGGSLHTISGNTISGTNDYAVRVEGGTDLTFNSGNTITDAVGGIRIEDTDGVTVDGNTISLSGNNAAISLENSDETVVTDNIIDADAFVELVSANSSSMSDNTMTDDDAATNGTNLHLQSSSNNIFDGNTITVSDATIMIMDEASNGNSVTDNTVNGQNLAVGGFELNDSDDNTFSGNTVSNIPGNAFALTGSTSGTVIGNSLLTEDSENTFLNNTTDVSIGSNVTQTLVRGNTTDHGDTADMLQYNGTEPIDSPTITRHTDTKLEGTASPSGVVDVYGRENDTSNVSFIDSVSVDADGNWSTNISTLANNSDIYLTVSTAANGTSSFITAVQPQAAVEISDVTATVLNTSSATISWTTNIASHSKIDYGTAANSLTSAKKDDTEVINHEITLTGLQSNTTYYYQAVSADTDYTANYSMSTVKSFTTEASKADTTLAEYAKTVSRTTTVTTAGGTTNIVGDGTTTAILPLADLTFVYHSDIDGGLNNFRLHFVLREAKKNAAVIINKKKAFDAAGYAKFKVKQQQLSLKKTYAVLTGVIKDDGNYVNNDGLAKRFTFTLLDVPQLIYPSTDVFYRMPEEFIVSSKAPSVTVYVDNSSGNEMFHCMAVMIDGIGSCQPPYHVPGLGEYTIRLVDARGGSISKPVLISDLAPNNTITTDTRSGHFYKRLIFTGQPTWTGLVGTGNTIELHIPQINGPMYAAVTGNSWVFQLTLTTLPFGSTTVTVIERNSTGDIVNQNDYLVYRSYRPVVPAVIAPDNNSSDTVAPTIQVISPNDQIMDIRNSAGNRIFFGGYTAGGQVVNLAEWYTDPGTYTVTLQNRNSLNIPSASTTFTFTITQPATNIIEVVEPEPELEEETTNSTNSNQTNTNTTDTNSNTNTSPTQPSTQQPDTDGDGLSDIVEDQLDTDPAQPDTDGDNVNDLDELTQDQGTDSDQDSFSDTTEADLGTDPTKPDTDGDGVSDAQEIEDRTDPTDPKSKKLLDTDKDGLADIEEPDYGTDPTNPDTDGDSLGDGDEVIIGTDPTNSDTDGDGLTDSQELTLQSDPLQFDSDSDGVADGTEVTTLRTSPVDFDSDDDALSDDEQRDYGTDPTDADTDNDGLLDGEEIDRTCDPLLTDSDQDDIDDLVEALAGTDCSSTDNLWSNLTGIETYLQEQARAIYEQTGTASTDYPLLTHKIVEAEADLDQTLTNQITTATTLDIIPGAKTIVSAGTVRVITQTTELSLTDWLTGNTPTATDNTAIVIQGQVTLPDSVAGQPTYVLVTLFSAPIVKIAQVDSNGQWTMTVPAELLTTGEHTALAALEVNGTRSEQVEVAKFVINHKRALSNTSWLIIVNVLVAVLALLAAIMVHLRRKRADQTYA